MSEYLAAAAPEPWRRTQQKRLTRGASAQVVAELGAHRYIANRRDTLDYAAVIAAGLPIGSGLIESGHKHVLQARLKLPACALVFGKTNAPVFIAA